MTETGIRLEEDERLDINFVINTINTVDNLIRNISGMEELTDEQYKEYLDGCSAVANRARVQLHNLRKKFSQKYNVPYDAIYRDGEILLR